MPPTPNSPGVPTLTGIEPTPEEKPKPDAPGTLRVVLGLGSDSNDRIVGTIDLGRARPQDPLPQVLAAAAARTGSLLLTEPVFSNADQVVPNTGQQIWLNPAAVVWCMRWSEFAKAHGVEDEASRT